MIIQTLASYLDKFGWKEYAVKKQEHQKEGFIKVSWFEGAADDGFTMYIDPVVEHHLLVFTVRQLAIIPKSTNEATKLKAFERILDANKSLPFGCYNYSEASGFVGFRLTVPLTDSEIDFDRFSRYLTISKRACESCGSSVFGTLNDAGPQWSKQGKTKNDADDFLERLMGHISHRSDDSD